MMIGCVMLLLVTGADSVLSSSKGSLYRSIER